MTQEIAIIEIKRKMFSDQINIICDLFGFQSITNIDDYLHLLITQMITDLNLTTSTDYKYTICKKTKLMHNLVFNIDVLELGLDIQTDLYKKNYHNIQMSIVEWINNYNNVMEKICSDEARESPWISASVSYSISPSTSCSPSPSPSAPQT